MGAARDPLEDTQKTELPCAYCGGSVRPIATSAPPPMHVLGDTQCLQSAFADDRGRPMWQWCCAPTEREFRAKVP